MEKLSTFPDIISSKRLILVLHLQKRNIFAKIKHAISNNHKLLKLLAYNSGWRMPPPRGTLTIKWGFDMMAHFFSRDRVFSATYCKGFAGAFPKLLVVGASVISIGLSDASAHPGTPQGPATSQGDGKAYNHAPNATGRGAYAGDQTSSDDTNYDQEDEATSATAPYHDPTSPVVSGNGLGADPDGDTNPVTNTRKISRIGDAAEAAFDPPYKVVTFEENGAKHNQKIEKAFKADFGVTFSKGLRRQICKGQRYYQYNSHCTYRRAPSGKFAALYDADERFGAPLALSFEAPVCAAAMAIYPTGGKEGERYEVTLKGTAAGGAVSPVKASFNWTKDTFRWRHMAGAYFMDKPIDKLEVSIKSKDAPAKVVRFLIDDVAFVTDSCDEVFSANANDGV